MARKPRIETTAVTAICVDPSNPESANRMRDKIIAQGGTVELLEHYTSLMHDVQVSGIDAIAKKYSAIVIMGNDKYDVAPESYNTRYPGGDPRKGFMHPKTVSEMTGTDITKARAVFEPLLIKAALRLGIPLVGICGGMQRINVVCGEEDGHGIGTLTQHLPDLVGHEAHAQETYGRPAHAATQEIQVIRDTKLAGMLHKNQLLDTNRAFVDLNSAPAANIKVSTRHHQAIEILAKGLKMSAYIDDHNLETHQPVRVIKAVEADTKGKYRNRFIMGMQFHPELVEEHHLGEALAERIVREARRYEKVHPAHARNGHPLLGASAGSNGHSHRR